MNDKPKPAPMPKFSPDKACALAMPGSRSGEPKTSGIKIRGTGAAIKGTMARGPMA
jgi:hypothetical protein